MALKKIAAPGDEPVTLDEAKLHLRVDQDDDDLLIGVLITAAREKAESICRRAFVTQKWELNLDAFPGRFASGCVSVPFMPTVFQTEPRYSVRFRGSKIELPLPELQTVEYVKYIDQTGALVTLDPGLYSVDNVSEPGALMPAPGTSWPATQAIMNAVKIAYTAGYGDAEDVPAGIKSWILLRLGALYENREEVVVGSRIVVLSMPFVDGLLDQYVIASL